jgi:hypothetical protein
MFWNQAQFMSARHFSSFENIKITYVGVPRIGYKDLLNHHVKKSEWVGNETHKLAIDWQIDKKCNSKVNHSQWVEIISEGASVFFLNQHFLNLLLLIRRLHELLFNEFTSLYNTTVFAMFFLEIEFSIETRVQNTYKFV